MEETSNLKSYCTKLLSACFLCCYLMVFRAKGCQLNAWGNLQQTFTAVDNWKLKTFPFWVGTVSSSVQCVNYCHANPNCQSVNFQITDHLCELNNVTRFEFPNSFIIHYSSMYYDAADDTFFDLMPRYISCKELLEAGHDVSGIYTIFPAGFTDGLQVYCDMETDGGGWIVIQRRQDGSVDFYRNWTDYQVGFGNLSGEFWIGNDILRSLTESAGTWKLRVDLEDWDNNTAFAEYGDFEVSGDNYQLNISSYNPNSTAGDSFTLHNGNLFTTQDKDNDLEPFNCVDSARGGWWYRSCYASNLNGVYSQKDERCFCNIVWHSWRQFDSLKACNIKICLSF